MLSFYFTSNGFYVCTMMTVVTVYIFMFGRVYLALSGLDSGISHEAKKLGNTALDAALNAQFLVQIGVFTAVPMINGLHIGIRIAAGLWRILMIGLLGFFIKAELGSRVTMVGSPGGMKSRFVVSSYSAKVAHVVYSFESKILVICV